LYCFDRDLHWNGNSLSKIAFKLFVRSAISRDGLMVNSPLEAARDFGGKACRQIGPSGEKNGDEDLTQHFFVMPVSSASVSKAAGRRVTSCSSQSKISRLAFGAEATAL